MQLTYAAGLRCNISSTSNLLVGSYLRVSKFLHGTHSPVKPLNITSFCNNKELFTIVTQLNIPNKYEKNDTSKIEIIESDL